MDCGALKGIANGELVNKDGRTTYSATVQYSCAENYTLVGVAKRTCQDQGQWLPEEPKCLCKSKSILNLENSIFHLNFSQFFPPIQDGRCPELPDIERGSVSISGLNANDTATYSCQVGHKLVGAKTISCRLGGSWSDVPPRCQFVDCGPPLPDVRHGSARLLNGTTTFASLVSYTCDADYTPDSSGRTIRICQEDGNWSFTPPTCKCINLNKLKKLF